MGVAEPVKSTEVPGVGHKGQAQVIEFCRFLAMKVWKSPLCVWLDDAALSFPSKPIPIILDPNPTA